MTQSANSTVLKYARHEKLEAIIRDRLGLGEEWFSVTSLPAFVIKLENSKLREFEDAFKQMLRTGCKWEVVLACFLHCHTYNSKQRIVRPARYDSDGELSHLPEKVWEPAARSIRPPDRDKRNSIGSNLNAAVRDIEAHGDLLSTLGGLEPPPFTVWSDPTTDGDMRDVRINADEAVVYVQKLLKWCRKLLSEDSFGNFKTVESVGQLVPCVYLDLVTPAANSGRTRRLTLTPVASILKAMSGETRYKSDQLREALNRFQRGYPRVHRALRAKIDELHHTSNETPDGWRQLFAAEQRRRSR
jgi:hypothetical protein